MKDQYNVHKVVDAKRQWFIFGTAQTFFTFLPFVSLLICILLFGSIGTESSFLIRLFFHLNLVIILGGFWIWWIKAWEQWDENFVIYMRKIYKSRPANKNVTVEINLPEELDYNPSNMISFFFFFKNTFRSLDVTRANMYNYGKWHSNLAFDIVIHNKITKIYATFPRKKYTQFLEGMVRLFPGVKIDIVEDLYKDWPQTWVEGQRVEGYSDVVGFNFGLKTAGFEALFKASDLPTKKGTSPLDNMLRSIRDSITDEKIITQFIFRANGNNLPYAEWQKQYANWRQDLFDKYSPRTADGKLDSHAFEALLPHEEREVNEATRWRTHQTLVQSSVKIMALCQREQVNFMENMLEKIGRVYYGNTSPIGDPGMEKKDITSTNQKYYRPKNGAPEFNYVYDRYIFPPESMSVVIDQFAEPLYNKFYYKKENLLRRKKLYKTVISRDLNAQWNGDKLLMDPINGAGIFQFPTKATSMMTFKDNFVTAPSMRMHEDVFNDGDE